MTNQETIQLINKGQVFFFAGSGISYSSGLPSAGKILNESIKLYLPMDDEFMKVRSDIFSNEENYKIQPEIFYENLLSVFENETVLDLWKCLCPELLLQNKFYLEPNINHYFLVEYSNKFSLPIFTPNFDTLFEEACQRLGINYQIILPKTKLQNETCNNIINGAKLEYLPIFKVHGSIPKTKNEKLTSLHTTMTSITQINIPVIDLLKSLCEKYRITFVGYSGRDIDYLPEIKNFIAPNRPIWINRFGNEITDTNAQTINADRVNYYPDEIFLKLSSDRYEEYNQISTLYPQKIIQKIIDNLGYNIKSNLRISNNEKILFLGLLLKDIGNYREALSILNSLDKNSLNIRQSCLLSINKAILLHENSKYLSCLIEAQATMILAKKNNLSEFEVLGKCFELEASRMLLAHDTTYIPIEFKNGVKYIRTIKLFFNFLLTFFFFKRIRILQPKQNPISIFATHQIIEHEIRMWSLIQAVISEKKIIVGIFRNLLIRRWQSIRKRSKLIGYAQGIANCYKFQVRIEGNKKSIEEGERIYDMTNAETGKELMIRNRAEIDFHMGKYPESVLSYEEFVRKSISSGNRLNAVKGFLGIINCRRAMQHPNDLSLSEFKQLKNLMGEIEGESWKDYFEKVLNEIKYGSQQCI